MSVLRFVSRCDVYGGILVRAISFPGGAIYMERAVDTQLNNTNIPSD